jgi:hypothetical protein
MVCDNAAKESQMIKTRIVSSLFILVLVGAVAQAMPKAPREVFGLRLGMSEALVHKLLRKIASQQKEERESEEAEQEVWILKKDSRFNYLLTKFSRDHRLIFVTVVARPNRVRYADIANVDEATKATDGTNYSYKWKVEAGRKQPGYLLIARGSSPEFLTSYSLYPTR